MSGEVLARRHAGAVVIDEGRELQDMCAVAGVLARDENTDAVRAVAAAAESQDHRGQGAVGVTAFGDKGLEEFREPVRAQKAFGPGFEKIAQMTTRATVALSQDRYPTDEIVNVDRYAGIQPFTRGKMGLAHNGQLTNAKEVADESNVNYWECTSDSDVGFRAIYNAAQAHGGDMVAGFRVVLPRLEGAFSFVGMTPTQLIAARDRHGVRPLVIGRLPNGDPMVASEVTGLKAAKAEFVREVLPGEMVVFDKDGERSELWAKPEVASCLFEYVYLSKGTNIINGKLVNDVRAEMGRRLARYAPVDADVVIDVPATGEQYALAYADEAGIPYGFGLRKNPNMGRGFIEPNTASRQAAARMKQEVLPETVRGKRVVLIDDSIVRGDSLPITIQKLREAGATEIHVRIPADMYVDVCNLGVATATKEELLGVRMGGDIKRMCEYLGADSLAFLPLPEMIDAVGSNELCSGCMGGDYAGEKPFVSMESLLSRTRKTGGLVVGAS